MPTEPFELYGMDLERAQALTLDESLTDADLHAALADLTDLLVHVPPDRPNRGDRLLAFGRAVAWQAAHRSGLTNLDAGSAAVSAERFPDYSVEYEAGRGPAVTPLSPRALAILVRFGWYATSGYTTATGARTRPDVWTEV